MDCPHSRDRMARCARGHGGNQHLEHDRHSVPSFPHDESAASPSYVGEKLTWRSVWVLTRVACGTEGSAER